MFLNGHNVTRLSEPTDNKDPGAKPDLEIDGPEKFDVYTPITPTVRNIWSTTYNKVVSGQAPNIVIFLRDTPATVEEIIAQFHAYPIAGLKRVWLVERNGRMTYLSGSK